MKINENKKMPWNSKTNLEYTITVYVISVASMFSLIIIGRYLDKKGDV